MKPEEIVPSLVPFLIVMIVVQAMLAVVFNASGVVAPVAAPDLGVPVSALGLYTAIWTVMSLAGGMLIDGLMRRHGAARTTQICVIVTGGGLLFAAAGDLWLVALSAVVVGFGSGMIVPCAVHMAARVTPPERAGVVIAINQCGIPVGYAIGGIVIPLMLTAMHWQTAMAVLGLALMSTVVLLQPMREQLDSDRDPSAPLGGKAFVEPARMAWTTPRLRLLGWVAFSCMAVQFTAITFMVSYVKIELQFSHIAAGTALFVSQMAAIPARIFFGWWLDRIARPLLVLGILASGSGLSCLALGMATPQWPYWLVLATAVACGAFMMGWNAVYMATVARFSPPGRQGTALGGTQIFNMVGGTLGPVIYSTILGVTGHYSLGFMLLALVPFTMGMRLLWLDRREEATA